MSAYDPKSLGKIAVAVPGTPVLIKSSGFIVRVVTVQSDPANAGTYCYLKDSNGNIIFKLGKGQSGTPPMLGTVGVDLSQLQIDSDTAGDGCFVSYV